MGQKTERYGRTHIGAMSKDRCGQRCLRERENTNTKRNQPVVRTLIDCIDDIAIGGGSVAQKPAIGMLLLMLINKIVLGNIKTYKSQHIGMTCFGNVCPNFYPARKFQLSNPQGSSKRRELVRICLCLCWPMSESNRWEADGGGSIEIGGIGGD